MGLLSKLKKAVTTKASPEALEAKKEEGRAHSRYVIEGAGFAWLTLDGLGLEGPVKNLSYGGLASRLDTDGRQAPSTIPVTTTATLTVLDRQCSLKLHSVRTTVVPGQGFVAGFKIEHDTPTSLMFLRESIEPMRCGSSATNLAPEMRNLTYRSAEWTCLRGDGPVDLLVRRGPGGELGDALVTMRTGGSYCEVSLRDGVLRTGRSDAETQGGLQAGSKGMASTSDIELTTLRQAICVLLGTTRDVRPLVQPLLVRLLLELHQNAQMPPRTHISCL